MALAISPPQARYSETGEFEKWEGGTVAWLENLKNDVEKLGSGWSNDIQGWFSGISNSNSWIANALKNAGEFAKSDFMGDRLKQTFGVVGTKGWTNALTDKFFYEKSGMRVSDLTSYFSMLTNPSNINNSMQSMMHASRPIADLDEATADWLLSYSQNFFWKFYFVFSFTKHFRKKRTVRVISRHLPVFR
jgi:hypothetical protein